MANLRATSALAHVKSTAPARSGITLREDASLQVVHLVDRREDPDYRRRIAQTFGVEAPLEPNTVVVGSATVAWIAPGQWLALGQVAATADGTDVSDAYCVLRLTGARASELLSKGVPIDLATVALPMNRCARTVLGSIPVLLIRETDGFVILVERNLAHAAWSWLADGGGALSS